MAEIKHSRSCGTCEFSKPQTSAASYEVNFEAGRNGNGPVTYRKFCSNKNSLSFLANINFYTDVTYNKGKPCHSKIVGTGAMAKSDYIEYQQGCVKIRLQNSKLSVNLQTECDFNDRNIENITSDLNSAVAVLKLAAEKIQTAKPSVAELGVEV